MNPYFKEYSEFLAALFPGKKEQKISVNAGNTCPNRDGKIGVGGCIYCNNQTFTPSYCLKNESITDQLESGIRFFGKKYPNMHYLAYFQSYTSTYNDPSKLKESFKSALNNDKIDGMIIGTRPDCIDESLVLELYEINKSGKKVIFEFGAETSNDNTLLEINRGHRWADTRRAVNLVAANGMHCGLHLIAGLPGEDKDTILRSVRDAVALPISTIKIHQLQVVKGTELHKRYENDKTYVTPFALEDYINLCVEIIKLVPRTIAIDRFVSQSPPEMLVAPKWGIKNYEFTNLLLKKLRENS